MADVTVQEQGTYPAEALVSSFFSDVPTDLRYTHCAYTQISPNTSTNQNSPNIEFIFPSLKAPYCYQLFDTQIEAAILITKADGVTVPDVTAMVAPVNNVLGSLFSHQILKLNDDIITQNGELYPYKCYIRRLLSFNNDVKNTQLTISGYFDDQISDNKDTEPTIGNIGFTERNKWFRENCEETSPYRPEGCSFKGPFMHDLSNVERILPPGFLLLTLILFQLQPRPFLLLFSK
jgi:hypothetical protein